MEFELAKSVCRWAQFFICPLMIEDSIEREVEAVDSGQYIIAMLIVTVNIQLLGAPESVNLNTNIPSW